MASITVFHQLVVWGSFFGYFLVVYLLSLTVKGVPSMYGVVARLLSEKENWLIMLLMTFMPLLVRTRDPPACAHAPSLTRTHARVQVDISSMAVQRELFPTVTDVLQERQRMTPEASSELGRGP